VGCFSGGIERRGLVRGDLGRDPRFPDIAGADAVGRHALLLGQAVHGHAKVVQGFLEDGARVDGWELSGGVCDFDIVGIVVAYEARL
jgi:hypothetical protein